MAYFKMVISIEDKDRNYLETKKREGFAYSFIIRKALQLYREQKTTG